MNFFDINEGYYDPNIDKCVKCPDSKCNNCDSNNPSRCLKCKPYSILDQETTKCESCYSENRPEKLITADCPELYELFFVKESFQDNEPFIEVYLDRETLGTKKNPGRVFDLIELDWTSQMWAHVTV